MTEWRRVEMLMRSSRPLLLVMAAAVFTVSCGEGAQSPVTPAAIAPAPTAQNHGPIASAPAPRNSAAKFEQDFMIDMIDHHEMAIQTAQMCLEKAVHEELRETCETIIATQRAEQQPMQAWLRDWYGISYQPQMKPGDVRMMERMASLSGAEFEIEFMEMMIRHHRKAIRAGEQCLRKAYHPELIQMCHDIIAAQSAEVQQFEQWLCQWYERCGGSR